MPRLTIDNRAVEVPEGTTILEAARKLGMEIPTLCFLAGHAPNTTCMVCLVKIGERWMPSCATPAAEGMQVESETEEVRKLRRTGLELLLSHHQGDCAAPCEHACPIHVDIPTMLRQVAGGDFAGAMVTIREEMALPGVLARTCGELCEKACRRREVDSAAGICALKRFVADTDLVSGSPYVPACKPASGKKVAIVGAGPVGLSATYHLLLAGHACTLFDERPEPGGMLRYEIGVEQLPREILDHEIGVIRKMGAEFEGNVGAVGGEWIAGLCVQFDAVLLADGAVGGGDLSPRADTRTHQTGVTGVFAAGERVRPGKQVARLAADGKAAAACVDQYLTGQTVTGLPAEFHVRAGRLPHEQVVALTVNGGSVARVKPDTAGLTADQARAEASRCLSCDCTDADACRLRRYAGMYAVRVGQYRGERRPLERFVQRGGVVYEPGKCILCGLCVQIAAEAGEELGLTFIGRGFDVRLAAPFDRPVAEGLTKAASQCAEACPTGALSLDRFSS